MNRVSFVVFAAASFHAESARSDDGRTAGGGLIATDICGLPGSACAQLAQSLVGANIEVFNVQCSGACNAIGSFSGDQAVIGFDSGIILSTGSVAEIVGPNDVPSQGRINQQPGDPQLSALVPGTPLCGFPGITPRRTCDAAILQFDFRYVLGCQGISTVSFEYVFASEEYNEFVLPIPEHSFNDVFAFFLNSQNIAIIPGTNSTPVAVENLHCGFFDERRCCPGPFRDCPPYGGPNCILFRNNSFLDLAPLCHLPTCVDDMNGPCPDALPIDTEMDGLTIPLLATGPVNPTGVNHIKLAIADVGDPRYDSNVFLKAGSFQCLDPVGACCDRATATCGEGVAQDACSGEWLPGLTCDRFNPPCRKQRMLVLLDRTGSMNAVRDTGHTRCFDALERAKQDVVDFFAANPQGEVAVKSCEPATEPETTPGPEYCARTRTFVVPDGMVTSYENLPLGLVIVPPP